jgi:hypothetical protein
VGGGAQSRKAQKMTGEVAKIGPRSVTEVQPAADLPSVVASITTSLQEAIKQMKADDISCELSAGQESCGRTYARFHLRAYRRGEKVLDKKV